MLGWAGAGASAENTGPAAVVRDTQENPAPRSFSAPGSSQGPGAPRSAPGTTSVWGHPFPQVSLRRQWKEGTTRGRG